VDIKTKQKIHIVKNVGGHLILKLTPMIKKYLTSTDIVELGESGKTILIPGRILDLKSEIVLGKRAILSSILTKKYLDSPVYLIKGGKAVGIVIIEEPKEILEQETKDLSKEYNFKLLSGWESNSLYMYPIEVISRFYPPKLVEGTEKTWSDVVTFKSMDLRSPKNLNNSELLDTHGKLHKMWQILPDPAEDMLNYHILVVDELGKRKMEFKEYNDNLDEMSENISKDFEKELANIKNTKMSVRAFAKNVDGKLVAIASTEEKDRMGTIIRASGWKLKNFKKNPVLPFAHRYNELPVGIVKNIRVEDKKLIFEPVFHEITQLSREVKQMYTSDPPIMRAFSVGFMLLELDDKDPHIIVKQELLEISAVPVPANASALSQISKSITKNQEREINEWIEKNTIVKKKKNYTCECLDCGNTIGSDKHCKDIKCPKCGGEMRKKERPGQGKEYTIEKELVVRPYENEHSCRLNSPDKYDKFARKNCAVKSDGKCIDFIFGILSTKKSELQAMRYKKSIWKASSARAHCKSKGGSFEVASPSKK